MLNSGRIPTSSVLGIGKRAYPVQMIGDVVAIEVREDWGIVLAVGRAYEAPARLYPKSSKPHHACYPFVIDDKSVAAQFVGHASVAVAGQLILDVLDDRRQFGVR